MDQQIRIHPSIHGSYLGYRQHGQFYLRYGESRRWCVSGALLLVLLHVLPSNPDNGDAHRSGFQTGCHPNNGTDT